MQRGPIFRLPLLANCSKLRAVHANVVFREGSGFRLRALTALTPARRLKFDSFTPLLKLRSEFLHCCVSPCNFTRLSIVQCYFCGDGAAENLLIDIAKGSRHEFSQPAGPGRRMNVPHDDAGAKDGEPSKSNAAHGVLLHAHEAGIAKPAACCASCRGQQTELGDSRLATPARKGAHHAEFQSL